MARTTFLITWWTWYVLALPMYWSYYTLMVERSGTTADTLAIPLAGHVVGMLVALPIYTQAVSALGRSWRELKPTRKAVIIACMLLASVWPALQVLEGLDFGCTPMFVYGTAGLLLIGWLIGLRGW